MGNHLLDLTIYEKGKYGWFIYVDPEIAGKKIPQDLSSILKLQRKPDAHGFAWTAMERRLRIFRPTNGKNK